MNQRPCVGHATQGRAQPGQDRDRPQPNNKRCHDPLAAKQASALSQKCWLAHLLLRFFVGMVLLMVFHASQALTLRVGVFEASPNLFLDDNGQASGIMGDLLNEIALQENWTLVTVPCTLVHCLERLEAAEIDILPSVYYTNERSKRFGFHHIPVMQSWSQLYARPGKMIHNLEDLDKMRVAVLAASTQEIYLRNLLNRLDINVEVSTVLEQEDGFEWTRDYRADATVADYFSGAQLAPKAGLVPTPVIFQTTQTFFAVPLDHHSDILAKIDSYLSVWHENPDSVFFQLLAKWHVGDYPISNDQKVSWTLVAVASVSALLLFFAMLMKIQLNRQRNLLNTSEQRLGSVFDSVDALIMTKDAKDLRYTYVNHKLEEFFAASKNEIIGKGDEEFITDQEALSTILEHDRMTLRSGKRQMMEFSLKSPATNETHHFLSVKTPLRNVHGKIEALTIVASDITERNRAEEVAHRMIHYDPLTNLSNRRGALDHLEHLHKRARKGHTIGAMLIINLDSFKKINDAHGFHIGDQVLIIIARRLEQTIRERDLAARSGADEFIVLLDRLGSNTAVAARNAMTASEKLRQAINNEPILIQGKSAYVTPSIGITLIHSSSANPESIIREADMAVHLAKSRGGDQITFYEADLKTEVEQRMWLEHDLLGALNSDQLSMQLQPQYSEDGKVTGAELLARWNHPKRGRVSPDIFIPVAEETGLINLLNEWTLKVACTTLKTLQQLDQPYPVSLNISPKWLMDTQFVDFVSRTLDLTGVPGNRLIFEVTEGLLIQDIQTVADRMQALARLGIRFSIDDFGTGYSNLANLKRLPLYELKIDKSLVQDIPADSDNIAIVRLILAMADQLNLRVVAEGVETEDQSRFLFNLECHAVQGFLYAAPMDIQKWFSDIEKAAGANTQKADTAEQPRSSASE